MTNLEVMQATNRAILATIRRTLNLHLAKNDESLKGARRYIFQGLQGFEAAAKADQLLALSQHEINIIRLTDKANKTFVTHLLTLFKDILMLQRRAQSLADNAALQSALQQIEKNLAALDANNIEMNLPIIQCQLTECQEIIHTPVKPVVEESKADTVANTAPVVASSTPIVVTPSVIATPVVMPTTATPANTTHLSAIDAILTAEPLSPASSTRASSASHTPSPRRFDFSTTTSAPATPHTPAAPAHSTVEELKVVPHLPVVMPLPPPVISVTSPQHSPVNNRKIAEEEPQDSLRVPLLSDTDKEPVSEPVNLVEQLYKILKEALYTEDALKFLSSQVTDVCCFKKGKPLDTALHRRLTLYSTGELRFNACLPENVKAMADCFPDEPQSRTDKTVKILGIARQANEQRSLFFFTPAGRSEATQRLYSTLAKVDVEHLTVERLNALKTALSSIDARLVRPTVAPQRQGQAIR